MDQKKKSKDTNPVLAEEPLYSSNSNSTFNKRTNEVPSQNNAYWTEKKKNNIRHAKNHSISILPKDDPKEKAL